MAGAGVQKAPTPPRQPLLGLQMGGCRRAGVPHPLHNRCVVWREQMSREGSRFGNRSGREGRVGRGLRLGGDPHVV